MSIQSKMQKVRAYKKHVTINEYRDEETSFNFYKDIYIAIGSIRKGSYEFNRYTEEGFDLFRETFVGLTQENALEEDIKLIDEFDNEFKVTYAPKSTHSRFYQVFLKVIK